MAKKLLSKPVAAKKSPVKKPVAKKTYSAEENLKRLVKSKMLDGFVSCTGGCWDHQDWLDLCAAIEDSGYTPIDFDQVGLMLEAKKGVACDCGCCCSE